MAAKSLRFIFCTKRGGQRRAGRAAAQILEEYKHYFIAAQRGMKQDECELLYSKCELSLYPPNEGWEPNTKPLETKPLKTKPLKSKDTKSVTDGTTKKGEDE